MLPALFVLHGESRVACTGVHGRVFAGRGEPLARPRQRRAPARPCAVWPSSPHARAWRTGSEDKTVRMCRIDGGHADRMTRPNRATHNSCRCCHVLPAHLLHKGRNDLAAHPLAWARVILPHPVLVNMEYGRIPVQRQQGAAQSGRRGSRLQSPPGPSSPTPPCTRAVRSLSRAHSRKHEESI